jgi:Mrp family chromosome partitioning ATPase/capsular polysaccharide biosynthesis protein
VTIEPPRTWPRSVSPPSGLEQTAAPPDARSTPSFDLGEVAGAVWRRRLPLGLWLALCLALSGWYLKVAPITYTAATMVILEPRQALGPSPSTSQTVVAPSLDVAQAESQIQVIRSERILASVFDVLNLQEAPELVGSGPGIRERLTTALGLGDPVSVNVGDARARAFQAFTDRVGVRRLGQSYVLEVSYQAASPEQAARVANATAVQYIKAQIDVKAAAALQGTEYLRGRIINIEAEQRAASEGVREGRIPDMLFSDADARIIGAALRPLSKSSPKSGLIVAFALTFGLVTGLLAVAVRHALDRTLNTRRQVRATLGVECLGVLPRVGRGRDLKRNGLLPLAHLAMDQPNSPFASGMRSIRTGILLAMPNRKQVIGIVSWAHGEGRSTVAINLAYLLSVPSDTVELVDADLHNPTLTAVLAPQASAGLNEVLLDGPGSPDNVSLSLSPVLGFIPAVRAMQDADPNLNLGSERMRTLLGRLCATRNVVLDLPPLAAGSDARALSPHLDGIVLVIEAGRTTIEEAAEAVRLLQASQGRVIGVILNKARRV